jgi:uncharacterized protein (DUF1330 family)
MMDTGNNSPVYMLVIGRVIDREKMQVYAKGLKDHLLYEDHEGYYTAAGSPVEMFEGDWPENQGAILARFPSREHARRFWYSDAYQNKVKPLREGAGAFTVAVFDELPAPDRIEWIGE